jgi:hypothetical protein
LYKATAGHQATFVGGSRNLLHTVGRPRLQDCLWIIQVHLSLFALIERHGHASSFSTACNELIISNSNE